SGGDDRVGVVDRAGRREMESPGRSAAQARRRWRFARDRSRHGAREARVVAAELAVTAEPVVAELVTAELAEPVLAELAEPVLAELVEPVIAEPAFMAGLAALAK